MALTCTDVLNDMREMLEGAAEVLAAKDNLAAASVVLIKAQEDVIRALRASLLNSEMHVAMLEKKLGGALQ